MFRVKDSNSNGMLYGLPLPSEGEYAICYQRIVTKKRTNEVKDNPHIYKIISPGTRFDFFDNCENQNYIFNFRVLRIKLPDGSCETLLTNLSNTEFSADDLSLIYKMRWGIETSFRKLKHTIGLTNFHAKKKEHIIQEIYARVIMYNFTEVITSHAVITRADAKYSYQVNFTVALLICRQFLRCEKDSFPAHFMGLICKNILPIRPEHSFSRKTRAKPTVCQF